MTEYWLISAPGDKTCQQTWETMNNVTSKQNNLSVNYKFHIPDLKVGTLDQLVGLSDDLGKLDVFVEQITRKVATYLGEVLEDQRDKLHENLMANNTDQRKICRKKKLSSKRKLLWRRSRSEDSDENGAFKSNTKLQDLNNRAESADVRCCYSRRRRGGRDSLPLNQNGDVHQEVAQSFEGNGYIKSADTCDGCNKTRHKSSKKFLHKSPKVGKDDNENENASSSHVDNYDANITSPKVTEQLKITPKRKISLKFRTRKDKLSHTDAFDQSNLNTDDVTTRNSDSCIKTNSARIRKYEISEDVLAQTNLDKDENIDEIASDIPIRSESVPANLALSIDENEKLSEDTKNDEKVEDSNTDDAFILNAGDLPSYITRFQWDMAKYPIKQSLRNISDIISKQVGQIDADLKTKSQAYNNLKGSLQNLEKKQTGSLLTRNLADLVKKEHFILDSEYLTTLLVIVPKAAFNEWNLNYEKLTDMIVPRSTQLVSQDADYGLFTVSLFKKVVDEFKLHAREKKFIVRDFSYNEEELAAGKNEITKLVTDKKKQFGPLVRWLKVNFSECFCAWIHVKALRVFVESVLRYGLPVNFQAIILHPNKKSIKRLRDVLNQLYGHLDSSALQSSGASENVDIPGLGFGQADYYPYVYYKLNVDMVDNKI